MLKNSLLKMITISVINIILFIIGIILFSIGDIEFREVNTYIMITIYESCIIIYYSIIKKKFLKNMFFLYKLFFNLYFILGVLIYELREKYLWRFITFRSGNILSVSRVLMMCSITLYIGYWIVSIFLNRKKSEKEININININKKGVFFVAVIFIILSWIGFMKLSNNFTLIPALAENKHLARVQFISNKDPIMYELYKLSYYSIALILILIIKTFKEKNYKNFEIIKYIFCLFIGIIPTLGYGSRFFMLYPIVLSIIVIVNINININYKKIFIVCGVIVFLTVLISTFRTYGEINSDLFIKVFSMDFFPEYSDFSYMLQVPYNKEEMFNAVIITGLISLFPGKILAVLGIDKSKYYLDIGKTMLQYFPNAGEILGIRIGMIGEVYLAIGIKIIIIMLILGGILTILSYKNMNGKRKFSYIFVICNVVLMACFSIPYGFSFLFSGIISSLLLLVVLGLVDYV